MNFVLTYCPAVPSEVARRKCFAKIGIGGGMTFGPFKLSPEIKNRLEQGRAEAWEAFACAVKEVEEGTITYADVFDSREF